MVNINQSFKTHSITSVWIIHVAYNKQIISHYSGFETIATDGKKPNLEHLYSTFKTKWNMA